MKRAIHQKDEVCWFNFSLPLLSTNMFDSTVGIQNSGSETTSCECPVKSAPLTLEGMIQLSIMDMFRLCRQFTGILLVISRALKTMTRQEMVFGFP